MTMAAAVKGVSEEGVGEGEGESLASARARAARTLERIACGYARPGREAELPLPLTSGEDGDPVRCFAYFPGFNTLLVFLFLTVSLSSFVFFVFLFFVSAFSF